MNTFLTRRALSIGLRFLVVSALLLIATFAIQAFAQEAVDGEIIIEEEVVVSEETPADIFVSEEVLLPSLTTLLSEEPSTTTEDLDNGTSSEPEMVVTATALILQDPELSTDKDDYHPGETVTILGKLFEAFQTITLKIAGFSFFNGDSNDEIVVETDADGSFETHFTLDDVFRLDYVITAANTLGEKLAEYAFTDGAASVNIEQCDNGAIGATPVACDNPGNPNNHWGTGNVNGSKAHWQEGDFLPYRAIVESPNPGVQRVSFSFDTAKSSEDKHAIDYLSSFDLTETTGAANSQHANQIDPCGDVIGTCNPASPSATAAIPVPTSLTTAYPSTCAAGTFAGTPTEGFLKAWAPAGITISGLTVTQNAPATTGDCEASFVINFTLSAPATVVFAWSGHVASSQNPGSGGYWGAGNTVPTGSPYHMHAGFAPQYSGALPPQCGTSVPKNQCEFNVGSQDLQLASSAIVAPGSIVIVKNTVGANGTFNYTSSGSGVTNFGITTVSNTGSQTFSSLAAGASGGSRTFTETVPSGWQNTALSCVSANGLSTVSTNLVSHIATVSNLAAGDTVTCTYTNTLQTGHIIVVKDAVPNDAQDFAFTNNFGNGNPASFNLDDDADGTLSNSRNSEVIAGTYAVSEGAVSGWTQTSASCSDGSPINAVVVSAGETVTCTFTNTKKGHIIVDKVTNPAGDTQSFNFTAGGAGYGNFSLTDEAAPNDQEVLPGTYSVAETLPAGWTQGTVSCSDGSPVSAIIVSAGETVTCTFNNNKQAHLIVDKVTNPSGDTQSFDFTTNAGSNFSLTDVATPHDSGAVAAGTYSVSETVPTGWDQTSATCSDGSPISAVVLSAGETVTCTFTNTKRGEIVLVKNTLGGDGTFDFVHQIAGLDASLTTVAGTDTDTSDKLAPADYSISETVPTGWDLTSATCDLGETIDNITVGAGETVTCTFTNTKRGSITIEKQTLPDGSVADFTFTGDVAGTLSDGETAGPISVAPGSYSSTEGLLSGWDLTNITCDDANSTGNTGTRVATFNVSAGENVKCTFTNTQRAHVVIVKDVIGNPDPTDFSFNNNFGLAHPATFMLDEDENGTLPSSRDFEVLPGTYVVSEDPLANWQLESATCDFGETVDSIDVAPGETVTCTFVNEKLISITLIKNTIGGNGDFDFDGTGLGLPTDIDLTTVAGTASQTFTGLDQDDEFTLAENVPSGWTLTSAVCTGGETPASITPEPGEDVTCTFTNTKKGHIVVDKITNPAGDAQSFNFTTSGTGYTGFALTDAANPNNQEVVPGAYTVAETLPAGWDQTSAVCDNGETPASLDVEPGETVTCTFTNTKRGEIVLVKNTLGGDGTFDFVHQIAGLDASLTTVAGTDTDTSDKLAPADYSISETVPTGWDLTSATCDSGETIDDITVGAGETVTCTFTNTKRGHIVVDKVTNPAGNSQSFAFITTGTGYTGFALTDAANPNNQEVVPGAYTVAETLPAGWDQTSAVCDNGETPASLDVGPGETVTCTFTNTKKGHLIVQKTTLPAGDATSFSVNATGNGTITGGGAGSITDATDEDYEVTPGVYGVTETVPAGWREVSNTCTNVDVAAGETETCLITNEKLAKLTIVKDAQPNDVSDFAFNGGTLGGFTLDDDAGIVDPPTGEALNEWSNSKVFTNVVATSYTVSETQPNQYWKMKSVSCVDAGGQPYGATAGTNSVTVVLTPGVDVTCTFVNEKVSPTRTQGFWQTHTTYTTGRFTALFGAGMVIGSPTAKTILTPAQLFGAYYSSIPKKSDGKQRTALDKARMQLLQQLVTAKLNCAAFGCAASVQTMISQADSAYSSTNAATILASASALDAYNNSGDTIVIGNAGKATPKTSQSLASIVFWDIPKP